MLPAVVEGVEGDVVKHVMRNEDQVVGRLEPGRQRRHQLLVQLGEVGLRRGEQGFVRG